MAKRLAGVALAAVMACAGAAEAAPLVIDFTIDSSTFFTSGAPPFGITQADFPASGSATLELSSAGITVQDFVLTIGAKSFDEAEFSKAEPYRDNANEFVGYLVEMPFNPGSPSTSFQIELDTNPTALRSKGFFYVRLPTGYLSCDRCVTSTVMGGISPVPLPSSAPLFGAAILAVGAAGYGVRRSKAA